MRCHGNTRVAGVLPCRRAQWQASSNLTSRRWTQKISRWRGIPSTTSSWPRASNRSDLTCCQLSGKALRARAMVSLTGQQRGGSLLGIKCQRTAQVSTALQCRARAAVANWKLCWHQHGPTSWQKEAEPGAREKYRQAGAPPLQLAARTLPRRAPTAKNSCSRTPERGRWMPPGKWAASARSERRLSSGAWPQSSLPEASQTSFRHRSARSPQAAEAAPAVQQLRPPSGL